MTEEKTKKSHKITIVTENCKGCGICVEFCPTHTLGLKKGKVVVVNPGELHRLPAVRPPLSRLRHHGGQRVRREVHEKQTSTRGAER